MLDLLLEDFVDYPLKSYSGILQPKGHHPVAVDP